MRVSPIRETFDPEEENLPSDHGGYLFAYRAHPSTTWSIAFIVAAVLFRDVTFYVFGVA